MLVNGDELHSILEVRYKTWMQEAKKPDVEKAEWVRGVMYGLRLAQQDLAHLLNRGR